MMYREKISKHEKILIIIEKVMPKNVKELFVKSFWREIAKINFSFNHIFMKKDTIIKVSSVLEKRKTWKSTLYFNSFKSIFICASEIKVFLYARKNDINIFTIGNKKIFRIY